MQTRKLIFFFISLLLLQACSLPGGSTGPIVGTPIPASGTILMQDDFSNPVSGWNHISSPGGVMDYDNGVYRFIVQAPRSIYWAAPGRQFADARIEVDTAKLGGPDSNRAGIMCRWTGDRFYLFMISSDGYFAIGLAQTLPDNTMKVTLLGQDQMAFSANIKTGMAINHLRADCAGNTLSFYINGFPVAQVNDSTLTSGKVGLLAGAFDEGGVDIVFDKFIVLQP